MKNTVEPYQKITPEPEKGLSSEIVELRKRQKLTNEIKESAFLTYLKIVWKNCFTFFNVLCFICVVALLIVRAPIANFSFALIFGLNLIIGIIQEIRSKYTVEKLKIVSDSKVFAIRDGQRVEIPAREIVLDDIICLELGNQIPTDCTILEGVVEINESMLTGESVPVKKSSGDNIFGGSFIVSGSCLCRVDKVAKDTFAQKLSQTAKKHNSPVSKLMSAMNTIIKTIGFAIVPIGVVMFIVNYFNLSSSYSDAILLQQAVLRTSTVVIGMIPSGMFLLTTMALAVGIINLSTHNTLIQDMYSLEMLARVDVLCLDKTGTITDGNMKVSKIIPLNGNDEQSVSDIMACLQKCLHDNNQTAKALNDYFCNYSSDKFKATDVLHFSSERKLSAVSFEGCGTYVFGAPSFVLNELPEDIKRQIDDCLASGMRVLLLAHSPDAICNETAPCNVTAVALIVLEDHVRSEAIATIEWFKNNSVDVKVISGDDPGAVSQIAMRAGVKDADKYLDLTTVGNDELRELADKYTVFGRVSPEQKQIIVKALKEKGRVVGMTGDGVNDILAMKEADCSITVATGSDAAKSVAKIVLLDDDFNSMPKVVIEGRRVINNTQQTSSIYLMKTIFTAVIAIFSIVMRSPYPFEPRHMIALEWLIIGIPPFFISIQPNKNLVKGNFISEVLYKAIPGALVLVLNVAIISLLGRAIQTSELMLTSMRIVALTLGGWAFLTMLCKPYNKYRTCLMVIDTLVLCVWIFFLADTSFFGLASFLPLSETWVNLLLILGVVIIDFPILFFANKLVVKISEKLKKAK